MEMMSKDQLYRFLSMVALNLMTSILDFCSEVCEEKFDTGHRWVSMRYENPGLLSLNSISLTKHHILMSGHCKS